MWIQVRTIDGKETRTVEDLSRLTKIESLRLKIQDIFNVSPQQQRLFYRGKQVNPFFVSPRHAPVGFWCFWQGLVLAESEWSSGVVAVSDPCELPVLMGIRPIVLAQEPGVRGVPAPGKKSAMLTVDVWSSYGHVSRCLGWC